MRMKGAGIAALGLLAALAGHLNSSQAAEREHGVTFAREGMSGINTSYAGEWQFMVGGGAAIFDCDRDGRDDLFIAGGAAPARLYRNVSQKGGSIRFSGQRHSGLGLTAVTGAYPLDIDSDGIMDLVLLRVGKNLVMRGKGNCRFERANAAWGFDGGDGWSTAFSATWEKGNSWPTLAIGNYINRREEISPWGSCTDNWLHRPASGRRGFAPPLPLTPSYCALSMLFTDWNRQGRQDLRVSNDREYYEGGQEQLWRMAPGESPRLYTEAEGWKYLRIWGMGIANADINGDTYPDFFLTSMADNKLQVIDPPAPGSVVKPSYKDIAYRSGLTTHRPYIGEDLKPSTSWHAEFADVNNDGREDIFIAKGNVAEMPDFARRDPNALLLQGDDGRFTETGVTAGVASTEISRGGGLADFNLDGRLDLLVVNRNANAEVWRNTTAAAGHWLALRLSQPKTNRDAIGAWIEVKRGSAISRKEVTSGGGHASGKNGWWHFGLGETETAEVRVLWPDGTAGPWQRVNADRFYVLARGRNPVARK